LKNGHPDQWTKTTYTIGCNDIRRVYSPIREETEDKAAETDMGLSVKGYCGLMFHLKKEEKE
jgi:hypothetical protein